MSDSNTDVIAGPDTEKHNIILVTEASDEWLNPRQRVDYRDHRETLATWALERGKSPDTREGYAFSTVRRRLAQLDDFYRWVWRTEGYTKRPSTDHADEYLEELAYEDSSASHKANVLKALKMLFKWRGEKEGWEPAVTFTGEYSDMQPREYFSRDERRALREAALEYGAVPEYEKLTHEGREEWATVLAQRFKKAKSEVGPTDFERANGWKVPSIVWTSLDCGLRPIEVGRARTSWVDAANQRLAIDADTASKRRDNYTVPIQESTADMLSRWLTERENYRKYDNTDRLWLNRESNPYNADSLGYLLRKLCEISDIDTRTRRISWYAIRHSTGTYMTREQDVKAAAAQLRNSPSTMAKYDQVPEDERRDALGDMG